MMNDGGGLPISQTHHPERWDSVQESGRVVGILIHIHLHQNPTYWGPPANRPDSGYSN